MNDEQSILTWPLRNVTHALRDQPPTDYVVDKFFATGSLNVVYGAPGSLKSMMLADLCCCVVKGKDWLPGAGEGGGGIATRKAGVFWYDYDNGTRRTDERFGALARAHELCPEDPLYYISMPAPMLDAGDVASVTYFMDMCRALGTELIVIDNLGMITGDVEENSAAMGSIMGALRLLAENTGAAVVLIHHQRKGGAGTSRAGDALRGHSTIEAALDLSLLVVREPHSSQISMNSTKTRGVDVPLVLAQFNYQHKSGTNDLDRAWFHGQQVGDAPNPKRMAVELMLREHGPLNKGDLTELAKEYSGYGMHQVRQEIDAMTRDGRLKMSRLGRAFVYEING